MSLNSSNEQYSLAALQAGKEEGASLSSKAPKQPLGKKEAWRRVGIVAGLVAWTFFGFALAQAIGLAAVYALQAAGVPLDQIDPIAFNAVANTIIYALAIVIILGIPMLVKKRKTTLEDLGLKRLVNGKDFLWLVVAVFAYLFLTVAVTLVARALFPGQDYDQAQETGFSNLAHQWQYFAAFVSLVIVAPVAEEIMFRGYLFGKLRKYAPVWVAVLLSAALFAVAHGQWNVGLDTFALGVVLAYARVWSGSLWVSIMLHMLKNGIAFYFLFVNPLVL